MIINNCKMLLIFSKRIFYELFCCNIIYFSKIILKNMFCFFIMHPF